MNVPTLCGSVGIQLLCTHINTIVHRTMVELWFFTASQYNVMVIFNEMPRKSERERKEFNVNRNAFLWFAAAAAAAVVVQRVWYFRWLRGKSIVKRKAKRNNRRKDNICFPMNFSLFSDVCATFLSSHFVCRHLIRST